MSSFNFFFHLPGFFISIGNFIGAGFSVQVKVKTNVSGKFCVLRSSGLSAALPGRSVVIAMSDFDWYLRCLLPLQWTLAVPSQVFSDPATFYSTQSSCDC